MDTHLEYPYKVKPTIMLMVCALFGVCAGVLARVAQTNDRGLILWRVIEFEVENATIFYWVLAGASAAFVALGALALLRGLLGEPPVLKLSPDEISIPPSLFRFENTVVPWRDVKRVSFQEVNGQHLMSLHYGDRRKATIARSMLPDTAAWDMVVTYAMSKTGTMVPGR